MPTAKEDLRVVKTRRNIEETFVRLLERMPFDQVTVRLIVSEALVNKGTFYRHYQDKYDLAEQAFAHVLEQARAGIRERVDGMAQGAPFAGLMTSFSTAQADVMPKLMAFRTVPLQGGSVEVQLERLLSEEFERAVQEWRAGGAAPAGASHGPQDHALPAWAVSNLALGYLKHCWDTGTAGDVRAYLQAVHDASSLYLAQLEKDR